MEIEKLFLFKLDSDDQKEHNRIRTELYKMTEDELYGGERLQPLLQEKIALNEIAGARAELLLMKGEIRQGKRKVKRLITFSLYRFLKQDIEDLYNSIDEFRTFLMDEGLGHPDYPAENTLRYENNLLTSMYRNFANEVSEYGTPQDYFYKKRAEETEVIKDLFFKKN